MKTILQAAALALVVVLGTAGTGQAQDQNGLTTGTDSHPLRGIKGVLKLESLTTQQRTQIETIIRSAGERARALRTMDQAERARAGRALRVETRRAIEAVLTPAQRAELRAARAAHPNR